MTVEEQLWQAFKAGDHQAFKQMYDEYVDLLYNYGRKFTRKNQIIEDTIHDLFVHLWDRKASLSNTDSISKYLVVSFRRRLQKELNSQQSKTLDLHEEGRLRATDTETVEQPDKQGLKRAISTLSTREQEAIYLKYYAGMDHEEIGEIMDLKYQSVRNLLHRAIQKLKGTLLMWMLILFGG